MHARSLFLSKRQNPSSFAVGPRLLPKRGRQRGRDEKILQDIQSTLCPPPHPPSPNLLHLGTYSQHQKNTMLLCRVSINQAGLPLLSPLFLPSMFFSTSKPSPFFPLLPATKETTSSRNTEPDKQAECRVGERGQHTRQTNTNKQTHTIPPPIPPLAAGPLTTLLLRKTEHSYKNPSRKNNTHT